MKKYRDGADFADGVFREIACGIHAPCSNRGLSGKGTADFSKREFDRSERLGNGLVEIARESTLLVDLSGEQAGAKGGGLRPRRCGGRRCSARFQGRGRAGSSPEADRQKERAADGERRRMDDAHRPELSWRRCLRRASLICARTPEGLARLEVLSEGVDGQRSGGRRLRPNIFARFSE